MKAYTHGSFCMQQSGVIHEQDLGLFEICIGTRAAISESRPTTNAAGNAQQQPELTRRDHSCQYDLTPHMLTPRNRAH